MIHGERDIQAFAALVAGGVCHLGASQRGRTYGGIENKDKLCNKSGEDTEESCTFKRKMTSFDS